MGVVYENSFKFERSLVVGVAREARGVNTYTIRLSGEYKASPGQFNMLYVYGLGEVPVSISSLPVHRGAYTLVDHTVRVVGAVTRAILLRLGVGSVIGVRGPYGRGWPLQEAWGRDVVIIAGGIGLAPLRPVIKFIEANREKYGRVNVLYGAKSPEHLLYKYELEEYTLIPNTRLLLSSDTPSENWRHHVGFVTDLVEYIDVDTKSAVALICGPEAMMRIAVKKLLEAGFAGENTYVSLERRMRCGVGVCGTCQLGHYFVCRDGPVFRYSDVEEYFWIEGV
ncbi:MAG: FAD/NAD(P)-binding protein [Desulfurococcaceae archaeon]